MEVMISRFISDKDMDLSIFNGSKMQVSFFQRSTFREFDHPYFYRRLLENNINIMSIHAPAADVYHYKDNEFINMLKTIKDIYKVKIITIHPQRGDKKEAKGHFERLEEVINEMDIILAYETFEKEAMNKKWISQLEEMHHYFDLLKFPFLGITYDFTHSTYEENIEEFKKYYEKIYVIHLSDALRNKPLDSNEYHQHLPLGYGDYRVVEFLDLIIEVNYAHFIVLEYHPEYDHLLKNDAFAVEEYLKGNKEILLSILEERKKMRCIRDL